MERHIALNYTSKLSGTLQKKAFVEYVRSSPKYFTRNKKLTFCDLMLFIIRGVKRSTQTELCDFMGKDADYSKVCSKQAFSKARQHVKPEAFIKLFDLGVEVFYRDAEVKRTPQGYRVFAIDGSKLDLPNSAEIISKFGTQDTIGESQAQGLASIAYDVLNDMIFDAVLAPCKANERHLAKNHIEKLAEKSDKKDIIIFDRGYPSAELIHTLDKSGFKYLMRCSTEFCKGFEISSDDCTIIHSFKSSDYKEPIKFRVATVDIPSGKEILITNLDGDEFTTKDLKNLYHLRWDIETEYDNLKNKLEIERFSGATSIAVLQDFYATMVLSNYAYMIVYDNEPEIDKINFTKDNKHIYKQNLNRTVAVLRNQFIDHIVRRNTHGVEQIYKALKKELLRSLVAIRSGRSYPRTVKHPSCKSDFNSR